MTKRRGFAAATADRIVRGWKRLRTMPIAYNLTLIVLVLCGIALVSFVGMAAGTRHGMKRTVPDFTGLRLQDADYYASRRGLELVVNDSLYVPAYPGGIVLEQLPKGGVNVKSGRKIYVTINSFRQKMVPLPYVAGRSLRQAKNMLEMAGLSIRELVYVEDIATNYVLAEYFDGVEITPETDMKVEKESGVTLHVGVAADDGATVVPRLVGRRLFDAESRLWEAGLNVGEVEFDEGITLLDKGDARVYWQSVPQMRGARLGDRISLRLTLDAEKVAECEMESDRETELYFRMRDSLATVGTDSLRLMNPESIPEPEQAPRPRADFEEAFGTW